MGSLCDWDLGMRPGKEELDSLCLYPGSRPPQNFSQLGVEPLNEADAVKCFL